MKSNVWKSNKIIPNSQKIPAAKCVLKGGCLKPLHSIVHTFIHL